MLPSELAEQRRHFSPGLPAAQRLPRDHRAMAGLSNPHCPAHHGKPWWAPRPGRAGPPWSSPAGVHRLRWGWGSCSRRVLPPLATGRGSASQNCLFTGRPTSEATQQLLWPIPLPGGAPPGRGPPGRGLGQSCGGQGPGD